MCSPEGAEVILNLTPQWSNGAEAGNVTIDLSSFSGFSTPSVLNLVGIDGSAPGNVVEITVLPSGQVNARLDNEENVFIGTLALAVFPNLDGLEARGNNLSRATPDVGEIRVGVPDSGGRGTLRNNALEGSTVDAANEFIDVIRFQRGYQAGSQVISTANDMLTSTIELA